MPRDYMTPLDLTREELALLAPKHPERASDDGAGVRSGQGAA